MSERRLSIPWRDSQHVSAALERPPEAGGPGLVLAHGAGGNFETSFLAELSIQLAGRGVSSLRFNFPYSENRRRIPDPAPTLEACYRAMARRAAQFFPPGLHRRSNSIGRLIA